MRQIVHKKTEIGERNYEGAIAVIKEHFLQIRSSFAGSVAEQLHFTSIGDPSLNETFLQRVCTENATNVSKINCIFEERFDSGYEGQTLMKLHTHCVDNPDHKVVYTHSKGSYHTADTHAPGFNDKWRRVMTDAVTSKECLEGLDGNANICGWLFWPLKAMWFPGNFWVARCDYIRSLLPPKVFASKLHRFSKEIVEPLLESQQLIYTFAIDSEDRREHWPESMGTGARFDWEFWVGSNSARIKPSDVYPTRVLGPHFLDSSCWSLAPRKSITDDANWRVLPDALQRALQNETLGLRTYSLLAGKLLESHAWNNELPNPKTSWVYDWYPNGEKWREAVKKYGKKAVDVVLNINVSEKIDKLLLEN